MEFNSFAFLIFFLFFYVLYWFVFNKNVKNQNVFLLIGSYLFYAWWDWRFLSVLIFSSVVNYLLAIYISKTEDERKKSILVYIALLQGLGGLLFFKYYNFFVTSLVASFSSIGISLNLSTLNIILPLGISFYTFKTISYILDVNNERIEPTKNWIVFFNYVSYFPSLLAGPIDKARDFIPQLEKKREPNYSNGLDGLRQILWGLFKKVVIADNCITVVNEIFGSYEILPGSTLLLGAFLNIIQIYADFSGYSDMAIGLSKLLGIQITKNFNYPFFAKNIAEFWQRWHMSLTTWMTEYVYTPLSFIFRDYGKWGTILAILINFILVGFWHGSNWTFAVFGLLHGFYFIPLILSGTMNKRPSPNSNDFLPSRTDFFKIVKTFTLVALTGVIFTTPTITDAVMYYKRMFSTSFFSMPVFPLGLFLTLKIVALVVIMFVVEWIERNQDFPLHHFGIDWNKTLRRSFYYLLIIIIIAFMGKEQEFIYFKF